MPTVLRAGEVVEIAREGFETRLRPRALGLEGSEGEVLAKGLLPLEVGVARVNRALCCG